MEGVNSLHLCNCLSSRPHVHSRTPEAADGGRMHCKAHLFKCFYKVTTANIFILTKTCIYRRCCNVIRRLIFMLFNERFSISIFVTVKKKNRAVWRSQCQCACYVSLSLSCELLLLMSLSCNHICLQMHNAGLHPAIHHL
jgi:hypothetical protein